MSSDSDIEEYYGIEQPPLLQQLRRILDEYRNDVQIIKELVQNADDAGAKEMKILYQGQTINEPLAKEKKYRKFLRAPALAFYNDSEFDENDWRGIRTIYSSVKADDPLKIGRFGLGFKSVFHLTDYPCIVSGDRIMFIDPHERQSGKVCVTVKLKNVTKWKRIDAEDCLKALNETFGFCEETLQSGRYHGTLFWFPLRTTATKLSEDVYDTSQVKQLLNSFIVESKRSLIFLKTVCRVTIYVDLGENYTFGEHTFEDKFELPNINLGKSEYFYSVDIENDNGDLTKIRRDFLKELEDIGRNIPQESKYWKFDVYVKTETKGLSNEVTVSKSRWLIINYLKGSNTSQHLRDLLDDENTCYHHLVGIAAPVHSSSDNPNDYCSNFGHIFCYQPLPQESKSMTGLPVHVNAFFALSQNRRQVKWPDEDELVIDKAIQWNLLLVSEILPDAYCELLVEMIRCCDRNGNPEYLVRSVYNLIPKMAIVSTRWIKLAELFVVLSLYHKVIFTTADVGQWVTVENAYIEPHVIESCLTAVAKLFSMEGIHLATIPEHVQLTFKNKLTFVTPDLVSKHMKGSNSYKAMSAEDKSNLLKFIASADAPELVTNLELIPLESKYYAPFGARPSVYLEENHIVIQLFPGHEDQFVSSMADDETVTILKKMIEKGSFQLKYMDITAFAKLIKQTLCEHFHTQCPIEIDSATCQRWKFWTQMVWTLIQDRYCHSIDRFSTLAIFPIIAEENCWEDAPTMKLLSLKDKLFQIESYKFTNTKERQCLLQSLKMLSVSVIHIFPPWLDKRNILDYIHNDSFKSLVAMVERFTDHDIKQFNEEATMDQRHQILLFLASKINGDLSDKCLQFLRNLKLFKEFESTEMVQQQFVCLKENANIFTETVFPVRFPSSYIIPEANINTQLFSYLNANIVNEEGMVSIVLKQVDMYLTEEKERFMLWLLESAKYLRDEKIKKLSAQVAFVLTDNGEVKRPGELFDPEDKQLKSMFKHEPVFPCEHVKYNSDIIQGFRKLGLKTQRNVTYKEIEQTCLVIDSMSNDTSKIDLDKAHTLTKFLNEHSNLLRKKVLRNMAFIPLQRERFDNYCTYLPCKTFEYGPKLCKPSEVKSSKLAHLIGSVTCLVSCEHLQKLSDTFGWEKQPKVQDVVQHLAVIVTHFEQRFKSSCLEMITNIYIWLSTQNITSVREALKQSFAQDNFIWIGDGFSHPKNVIVDTSEGDLNVEPFVYILPGELQEMKKFFLDIGCVKCISMDTYLNILERLQDATCKSTLPVSTSTAKNLAIMILNKLATDYADDVLNSGRPVYFPIHTTDNTSLVMKPATLCAFCDAQWLQNSDVLVEDDEISYIHPEVPNVTAEALGVPSLRQQMLSDAEAFEEWGQEESLTRRLNILLKEGYADGFSIAKELFQNADDAGASKLWIMYDERENLDARTQLITDGMAEWQGPALWVYNDAVFTDDDFKNITQLNGATKEDDSTKIGKFGLGFCAVYNVTDVPSFISRETVVIFDPHTSFLSNALTSKRPGLKINFKQIKNVKMMKKLRNQFKPFEQVFGCQLLSTSKPYFNGTLFRLPLRQRASEISSKIYTTTKVEKMFDKIRNMSANLFIFNQNVVELKLFHLPATSHNPENACQIFHVDKETIRMKMSPEYLFVEHNSHARSRDESIANKHISVMVAATRCKREKQIEQQPIQILEKVSIKVDTCSNNSTKTTTGRWLVSWSSALNDETLKKAYLEKGALPLAAVAVPVIEETQETHTKNYQLIRLDELAETFYKTGHFFCFLPLPIEHNFQWHINGQFSVTSDRRHLRTATEDDTNTNIKQWNDCLLNDAVVHSLLHLLENLKNYCDNSKYSFHQLWPRNDKSQLTKCLPVSFYKMVTNTETVSIFKSKANWSNFNNSVFFNPKLQKDESVGEIAFELMSEITEEENLIDIPSDIYEILLEVGGTEMQKRTITHEILLLKYFLPNLSRFQNDPSKRQKRDVLLKYALFLDNAKVSSWLKANACIPTKARTELKKPSELIDPKSNVGKMFTIADGYFPACPFDDDITIGCLKEHGIMHKTITNSLVINRANSVRLLNKKCTKCALERCNVLFEYLSENRTTHRDTFHEMRSIACVPVMAKPNMWPFQWEADTLVNAKRAKPKTCKAHILIQQQKCVFEQPCKIYDRACVNLVGCLFVISDLHGVHKHPVEMKQLLCAIGVNGCQKDVIEPNVVLKQLEALVNSYNPEKSNISSSVTKIFEDIYEFLEKVIAKPNYADSIINLFGQKPFVFVNDTFTTCDCVAENLQDNCMPYLYGLQGSPLSKCKALMKSLGIKKCFHPRDFAKILQSIYREQSNAPLSENTLQTCLKLLTCLYKSMTASGISDILDSDLGAIYAPDCEHVLRDTQTMCFDDFDSIEKSEAMIYIHGSVSKNEAKAFGVKRKIIQNLEESSEDIEDFYQKEPLLIRLRRLIEGYPCDTGMFKELLQNADDSGASEVCFLKDYTLHKTKDGEAFSSYLLGPSLCVFNNSSFSKKDFEGIQKLGIGSKSDDPTQTGRYGVGFNAVYNLTDVPSFLTKGPEIENGETICFFDPNARYIPMVTAQKPGKRYKNMEAIRHHHSYLLQGYHEKQFFTDGKGTMFRFPLRNTEMAKTSEIKKDAIQVKQVTQLLDSLSRELEDILIFLKHIKTVTILTYNGQTYCQDYRIEVCLSKEDNEKRNVFIQNQTAVNSSLKEERSVLFTSGQQGVCYELSYSEYRDNIKIPLNYQYLVVQYFGFPEQTVMQDILKENCSKGNIGLLPLGGVALRLPFDCDTTKSDKRKPRAFYSLPLPIETGLPINVNGCFALDHESRRSLWFSENATCCYKTQWNLALIGHIICPAYIHLIETMKSRLLQSFVDITSTYDLVFGAVEKFQSIFPDYSAAEHVYWKELAKCIYKELVLKRVPFLPVMRSNVQNVQSDTDNTSKIETMMSWTSLEVTAQSFPAYFNEELMYTNERFLLSRNNMLRDIGMRIVYASKVMLDSMESAGVPLKTLQPNHVIDYLCSFNTKLPGCCSVRTSCSITDTSLKSISNATIIVEFCLKDKKCFVQKCGQVPIFITENNIVKTLSESKPLYVSDYSDFFENEKHLFLNKAFTTLFTADLQMYKQMLIPFTLHDFVLLARRSNMTEILSDKLLKWNGSNPPISWIKRFWEYFLYSVTVHFEGHSNKAMAVIQNLSLLLTVQLASGEQQLLSINCINHLIDVRSFADGTLLRLTLEKLKLPEVDKNCLPNDSIYNAVMKQVPNYKQPIQMATCLHLYKNVIKSVSLNCSEAGALAQYFDDSVVQLESVKDLLKDLPIYLSHFGEIVALSNYVDVCTVPRTFPKDGISELSKTGLLMLSHSHMKSLFALLGVFIGSVSDIYIKYIFPRQATMQREAFYRHLEYISSQDTIKQKDLLVRLYSIAFVEMQNRERVFVRTLFNHDHPIFKVMCKPTELLPMELRKEKLIALFLRIGLKNTMTMELFERFAKEIAMEGVENGAKKSGLLCKTLFEMDIPFLQINSLETISKIKFIPPFIVDEHLGKIHKQHAEQTLICFSGSVIPSHKYTCWTVSNILSMSADPSKYFRKGNELKTLKQKLNVIYPNLTLIKQHCENIGKSLNIKLKKAPNNVHNETVRLVMEHIYKALKKLSGQDQASLAVLHHVPLIYFPVEKYMRTGYSIVINCTEKDQIPPYLQKAPVEYGEFHEVFIALGASIETSYHNYATVLEKLHTDSGNGVLLPPEKHAAIQAIGNMLKHILRDESKHIFELKLNKLYLLNSNGTLCEAKTLVVANNPYLQSRLSKGITLNYLANLEHICDKELKIDDCIGSLQRLSDKYRPYFLTDIVVEKVCLKNISIQDMREAQLLEDFLHSSMFINGFLRLASHAAKRTSMSWSTEFENKVINIIRRLTCKHVSGISTILTVRAIQECGLGTETEVAHTRISKVCHLEERNNKVIIYFDQAASKWRKHIKEELSLYFTKIVHGCLKDKMCFLLSDVLDMQKTPEEISKLLDKESVDIAHSYTDDTNQEDHCPKPGTYVPNKLHMHLDNDYGCIYEFDYKFVAYEMDDPYLKDELLQHDSSQETEMSPIYIFVRILKKIEPICDLPLMQIYEIDTGDALPKTVPAYMLYKFIRKKESDSIIVQKLVVYSGPETACKHSSPEKTLKEVYAEIRHYLKGAKDDMERRHIYKRLMLKWHPDKNPNNISFCTKVCHYIQKCIDRLGKGLSLEDDDSGNDTDYKSSKSYTFNESSDWSWYQRYRQYYEQSSSRERSTHREYNESKYTDFSDFFKSSSTSAEPEPYHYYSEAQRWQRQAQFDIEHAQSCMDCLPSPAYNWICYISHQAAEKSLKAGWYAKDANKVNRIRNSCNLNSIAQDLGDQLVLLASKLSSLIKEYTRMTYPDATSISADNYDRGTAQNVIKIATDLIATVQRLYLQ